MLHAKPKGPWEICWEVLICGLHKHLHSFLGEFVVAQVNLLDRLAMLENVGQLPSTLIVDAITEKLQDPKV